MFRKNSERHTDDVPWYRAKTYRGKMTEANKRRLDAIRSQPVHPAASYEDLPDEAQQYIARLELEVYDAKQHTIITQTVLAVALGVAIVAVSYFGVSIEPTESPWPYLFAAGLIATAIFSLRREFNRNADEFIPRSPNAPTSTNEQLKMEWELSYVTAHRYDE